MNSFNLSDWALGHRSLVWYFMIAFMAAGLFSYLQLGREEDPAFTIKTMVVQVQWPGASAEEITRQVTDRNVIRIFDIGEAGKTKFITMEYLEGENLHQILKKRGKLDVAEAVDIMEQVASGLAAAHREGEYGAAAGVGIPAFWDSLSLGRSGIVYRHCS